MIESTVARELDLPLARAAWGIHETANEDVARAFRVHAAERGFDYRGCSMIAFGGCGPIHATRIARKLKIPEVVFPSGAGVMSAFGLLVSSLSHETIKSDRLLLDELAADVFEAKFAALTDEVMSFLREGGVGAAEATVLRRLDMRYLGQGYEIEVALPNNVDTNELLERLPALFAGKLCAGLLDELYRAAPRDRELEGSRVRAAALAERRAACSGRAGMRDATPRPSRGGGKCTCLRTSVMPSAQSTTDTRCR